jgi:hypothetical protein
MTVARRRVASRGATLSLHEREPLPFFSRVSFWRVSAVRCTQTTPLAARAAGRSTESPSVSTTAKRCGCTGPSYQLEKAGESLLWAGPPSRQTNPRRPP